jgi:hypothetical protein
MRIFIGFVFGHWELSASYVFETSNAGELPAENGFVEYKCFFGISVEINVWVYGCHNLVLKCFNTFSARSLTPWQNL